MRIAVIGSRGFNDEKLLDEVLKEYLPEITLIVSGGAKGADKFGEKWAIKNKIPTLIFLPDWNKFGNSAGYRRNIDIILNCDLAIAFWDGKSKGTKSSIDLCTQHDKPCKIIKYEEQHRHSV